MDNYAMDLFLEEQEEEKKRMKNNKFAEMHESMKDQMRLLPLESRQLVTTMLENAFLRGQLYQLEK